MATPPTSVPLVVDPVSVPENPEVEDSQQANTRPVVDAVDERSRIAIGRTAREAEQARQGRRQRWEETLARQSQRRLEVNAASPCTEETGVANETRAHLQG